MKIVCLREEQEAQKDTVTRVAKVGRSRPKRADAAVVNPARYRRQDIRRGFNISSVQDEAAAGFCIATAGLNTQM